jgi:hypothetical protein
MYVIVSVNSRDIHAWKSTRMPLQKCRRTKTLGNQEHEAVWLKGEDEWEFFLYLVRWRKRGWRQKLID